MMTGWKIGIAVAAMVSCLTPREPVPEQVVKTPCPARPPPVPPKVVWLPEGCPPAFGACLVGPDAGAVADYLDASRRWMNDARRCGEHPDAAVR